MIILSANDISKEYRNGNNKSAALRNTSVEVEKGDFISIVGKSGAGKSTLLFVLAGIKNPDTGDVQLKGRSIGNMNDKELSEVHGKEIGIVFQDSKLIEELSVYDNIALPGYMYRKKADVNNDVKGVLKSLQMEDQKDKYPNQLSAGQQQRIAFARALINRPSIIFLDEPTGNLDAQTGRWIYNQLSKLNKAGKTIIMVTHDAYAAAAISSKVWVLDSGTVKKEIKFDNQTNNQDEISNRSKVIYREMYL